MMKKLLAMLLTLALMLALALPLALAEGEDAVTDGTEEWAEDEAWDGEEEVDDEDGLTEQDYAIDDDSDADLVDIDSLSSVQQDDWEGAMEVYSWFAMEPLDVDESRPDTSGTMWRVLDERFDTKAKMMDMLSSYFSGEIVDSLWGSEVNPYTEIDGYLFTDGEGRSMDERIGEYSIDVARSTDEKVELNVTVYYTDAGEDGQTQESFHYTRELQGGQWKYTEFPFFW